MSTEAITYSSYPKFSECFQQTAFTFLPCGWLWLTAGFHLAYLHRHTRFITLPDSWLHRARRWVSAALAAVSGLHLFLPLQETAEFPPSFYLSQTVWLLTYLLATVLVVLSRRCGVLSPCVVFIFWFLTLLVSGASFYTTLMQKLYETQLLRFCMDLVTFVLTVAEFGLQVTNDSQVQLVNLSSFKQPCPEMTASFVSKLTFSWISRLMYQTKKKSVAVSDIFDVPGFMQCQHNVPTFTDALREETLKGEKFKNAYQNGHSVKEIDYKKETDKTRLISKKNKTKVSKTTRLPANSKQDSLDNPTETKTHKNKTVSLYRPLVKMYAVPFLKVCAVGFIREVTRFSSPALLGLMLNYLDKRDELPKWQGYALAVALFVVNLTSGILDTYCFYCSNNIATRVKTVLAAAVYKKTLTMSAQARRCFPVGTIVNLVTIDCQKICDITTRLYVTVMWPVGVFFMFILMYRVLGLAAIVGIVGLLVLLPANALIMALLRRTQIKQLKFKDHRIKLLSEILNGIKVLKLNAWEEPFQKRVLDARLCEVKELRKTATLNAINTLCWVASPALVILSTFAAYLLITGDPLTPAKAFVTVDLINTMRGNMAYLPNTMDMLTQSQVAMRRLKTYLVDDDLVPKENVHTNQDFPIHMRNATFTWNRAATSVLQNMNMKIPHGKLIAVVGPVGAGKSSLLSAILGEMEKLSGHSSLTGRVTYVPQQPWILNMTLQDNVRLQKPLERALFEHVISACALEADIELLPGGDLTEIGEKGTNLSGGQKQRVSLARAVYQDSDVYLLDDPLSAVDTHVGKHIFRHVIGQQGLLKDKTRVMVTHGVHWLPLVDAIIVMDQGRITEAGTYEELMNHDGPFAQFLRTHLLDQKDEENKDSLGKTRGNNRLVSKTKEYEKLQKNITHNRFANGQVVKPNKAYHCKDDPGLRDESKLIEAETVEDGEIHASVFLALVRAFGYVPAAAAFCLLLLYNGGNLAAGLWLSEWTNDVYLANVTNRGTEKYYSDTGVYIGIYAVLVFLQVFGNALFVMLVFIQMVTASQRLHNKMVNSILHQPMVFFDTTPSGRILNRFSRDIEVLDSYVPRLCWIVLHNFLNIIITIIIIGYSTPIAMAVLPPLAYLYFKIQRFYVHIYRHFRRLELTTRSPIISLLADTVHGAASIRAYGIGDHYFREFQDILDTNNKCNFVADTGARWIKPRLKLLTSALVLLVSLFVVLSSDVSASMGGLSITMALQVTFSLNMLVQYIAMQETNIVSCERVIDYISLPFEPLWVNARQRPPFNWPSQGMISFKKFSTRYRPTLDVVLREVSFNVQPGQKVGVVGRTGAGKSSLTVALFRLIEATKGSICIDDLDISTVGLHDLRAGLTILPQDPVLFSGTVRFNLDPCQCHCDSTIWEALDHAHISSCVKQLPGQLDHQVEDGGHNLSVGQRQLMCLARSLLRETRILVFDEATAAVDLETDALLQDTIREAFKDCTVLTVAHRLNTVIDYDKILVLENGEIAEYGSPSELLRKTSGIFFHMAKTSGLLG